MAATVSIAVVLMLVGTLGGRIAVGEAQQAKTDAERISHLETQVSMLTSHVAELEAKTSDDVQFVPAVAPQSEVDMGSYLLIDPRYSSDYIYYQYCKIAPFGASIWNEYELMCIVLDSTR